MNGAKGSNWASHLIPQLQMLWTPMHVIVGVLAVALFISGFVKLARASAQRQPLKGGFYTLGAALFLSAIDFWIKTLSNTAFNNNINAGSLLSQSPSVAGVAGPDITAAIYLIYVVGFITMVRSAFEFKQAAHDPNRMGKAWTHLAGGIALLNLPKVIMIVLASLGMSTIGLPGGL